MDAATVTALLTGVIGILGVIGTYRTSARKSDLDALERTVNVQRQTIETLQEELAREKQARREAEAEIERLRKESQEEIERLQDRIAELEGVDKRRRRGLGQYPPRDRGGLE